MGIFCHCIVWQHISIITHYLELMSFLPHNTQVFIAINFTTVTETNPVNFK